MSPTFTDPRTGETVELRQLPNGLWQSACRHAVAYKAARGRIEVAVGGDRVTPSDALLLVPGDITSPADVQSALWALEGALAGRQLAEENKRLREIAESARFLSDVFARLDRTGDLVIDVAGGVSAQFEVGEAIDRLQTALTKEAPDA